MINCPKCGKDNQDHYKFCLGCGSELPRDAVAPQRNFSTPTPPAGVPMGSGAEPAVVAGGRMGAAPAASPSRQVSSPAAPAAAPAASVGGMRACPGCGTQNPVAFKFCGACGGRLDEAAAASAAPVAAAPAASAAGAAAQLVLIRPDGSEGGSFALQEGSCTVGREAGELFAADAYLSPQHCTFVCTGTKVTVRDDSSLNGVYVRIPAETPIEMAPGDVMRLGQELVRIENLPDGRVHDDGTEVMGSVFDEVWGRVSLIVGEDATANSFCLVGDGVVLGRERGDVLFPEDGYVSGTHVRIHRQGDRLIAMDLGSSNGTFFRVNGERELLNGDYILMGQQLFRLDF